MSRPSMRATLIATAVAGFAVLFDGASAGVAAGEGWQEVGPTRVRLVGAGRVDAALLAGRSHLPDPLLLAGVEIRLDKGWKTYWRTPGDGIAPQFDWTGLRNVMATQVLWPAPRRFQDIAGEYNGYKDRVIFPVLVAPRAAGSAARLELSLEYAVCADICVPVSATLTAALSGDAPQSERGPIMAALARTPLRADAQGRCPDGLVFSGVGARLTGDAPRLVIEIAHRQGAQPHDLFVEAANGTFLPSPQAQKHGAGRTIYRIDLAGAGNLEALAGQAVTITAVGAQQSCETALTVK